MPPDEADIHVQMWDRKAWFHTRRELLRQWELKNADDAEFTEHTDRNTMGNGG